MFLLFFDFSKLDSGQLLDQALVASALRHDFALVHPLCHQQELDLLLHQFLFLSGCILIYVGSFLNTINLDGHLEELPHSLHIIQPGLSGCLNQD